MRRRARSAWLLLAFALGCGAPAPTPGDVAAAYFRALGRDPLRTLPLLTPDFHRRHALRVVTAAYAQALAERRSPAEPPAALAVDRHQLGWLAIQSRPGLAALLASLAIRPGAVAEQGDAATVSVHVEPRGAPPFEQRFALVREADAWRIDAIEQVGVAPANATAAFAAWPNEASRRALSARPR